MGIMRRRRAFVAGAIIGANVAARQEYRREVRRACRLGCTCYICVPCVRYTSRGPCPCAQCGAVNVTRQTSVTYVQTGYAPPSPQNNSINYYQQPPGNQPGQYGPPPSTSYQRPPGPDYQAPPPSAPSYGNGPASGPPGS